MDETPPLHHPAHPNFTPYQFWPGFYPSFKNLTPETSIAHVVPSIPYLNRVSQPGFRLQLNSTAPSRRRYPRSRVKRGAVKTFNPSVATYAVAVATASCLTLLPVFASQIQQPERTFHHPSHRPRPHRPVTPPSPALPITAHYTVYHGKDETTPIAEMTVNTTYRRASARVT